jgi:hypothetical protein
VNSRIDFLLNESLDLICLWLHSSALTLSSHFLSIPSIRITSTHGRNNYLTVIHIYTRILFYPCVSVCLSVRLSVHLSVCVSVRNKFLSVFSATTHRRGFIILALSFLVCLDMVGFSFVYIQSHFPVYLYVYSRSL